MKNEMTLKAEEAIAELIKLIGENPEREGLLKTPHRFVKAFVELTSGYSDDPKKILASTFTDTCDEMVVVREIPFWSLCEHHMLPFHGVATVGYLPKGKIIGLSKIARLVHCFAKRLQVQERLTQEIANALMEAVQPHGVGVVIAATHSCMEMRGIKSPAEMVTSCLLGDFREVSTRAEFLSMR
ncbi:MAG: cyclohydrolase [Bacteriovoracaceae bacterium]|nr:cyclohydrolase [Bacteriovoracaceae bacterium]